MRIKILKRVTAGQRAKEVGLEGKFEVIEMTHKSPQTIDNWHKYNPDLYEIVLAGCLAIKEKRNER